jgi:hypothetical protein
MRLSKRRRLDREGEEGDKAHEVWAKEVRRNGYHGSF